MLFINGNLHKKNVELADNEFEYYRLIGEAYNTQLLGRASITADVRKELVTNVKHAKAQEQFYTYVINGIP